MVPEKGDLVFFLDFYPQSGHEQAGHRPAIVLTPKLFNQGHFAVVCPITSKKKRNLFEVELPDGLQISGVILTNQLRSLDWKSRKLKIVDKAPDIIVHRCLRIINTFLNFEQDQ